MACFNNSNDFDTKSINKGSTRLFGGRISLTQRELGVLGAVVNGAWGGIESDSVTRPAETMKTTGAGYLISYATGALIVNTGIWLPTLFISCLSKKGQWQEALEALPSGI
jgi:hypothetical protein